jgi:hypothetical protein
MHAANAAVYVTPMLLMLVGYCPNSIFYETTKISTVTIPLYNLCIKLGDYSFLKSTTGTLVDFFTEILAKGKRTSLFCDSIHSAENH